MASMAIVVVHFYTIIKRRDGKTVWGLEEEYGTQRYRLLFVVLIPFPSPLPTSFLPMGVGVGWGIWGQGGGVGGGDVGDLGKDLLYKVPGP